MDDYVVIDSQRKKRKSGKKKSSNKKLIKDETEDAAEVVEYLEDDDHGNFLLTHRHMFMGCSLPISALAVFSQFLIDSIMGNRGGGGAQ